MSLELEIALKRIDRNVEAKVAEALEADYPVSVAVDGREYRTMNSVVAKIFDLFANKENWKFPVQSQVALSRVAPFIPSNVGGAPSIRSFIASCVSFHVGGETLIGTKIEDGTLFIVARNAGYYNNIGA